MSKLDGIKAGDRVRVTFEGVVDDMFDGGMTLGRDNVVSDKIWWGPRATSAPTFQITRIDRALAIGDEVTILGKQKGKVLGFLSNGNVAVEYQAGDTSWCGPYHLSCLTHA